MNARKHKLLPSHIYIFTLFLDTSMYDVIPAFEQKGKDVSIQFDHVNENSTCLISFQFHCQNKDIETIAKPLQEAFYSVSLNDVIFGIFFL